MYIVMDSQRAMDSIFFGSTMTREEEVIYGNPGGRTSLHQRKEYMPGTRKIYREGNGILWEERKNLDGSVVHNELGDDHV